VANIKSQIKRNKQNEVARERNKAVKTGLKSAVRKFRETAEAGDKDAALKAADDASKKLNEYLVEQAWFAPWYRIEGNFALDSKTTTVAQSDNTYPYLWSFKPKA